MLSACDADAATAGGPYWCAEDDVAIALTSCMTTPELISVDFLHGIMESTALTGFTDPLSNLQTARVWLLSALNDTVVATGVVRAAEALYSRFVADPANQIVAIYDQPGEHSQLTLSYGNQCDTLGKPFLNNCAFDSAGSILKQMIWDRTLSPPSSLPPQGLLANFSQAAFVGGIFSDAFGLQDSGYIYVPPGCLNQAQACPLHLAFHGCEMTLDDIGLLYVQNAGYQRWADTNNIIVLFPQAKANLLNPNGCWDWWGYTGPAYSSNIGAQTLTVKRMIDSLMGEPLTPNTTYSDAVLVRKLAAAQGTSLNHHSDAVLELRRQARDADPASLA